MIAFALLAIAVATADPDLCLALGRSGKYEESIRACSAALKAGTGDPALLYTVRGESYRRLGELDRPLRPAFSLCRTRLSALAGRRGRRGSRGAG